MKATTLTVKGVPSELRARLEGSAELNYRSLNQEALARIELSYAFEDAARQASDQAAVNEAMRSKTSELNPDELLRSVRTAITGRRTGQKGTAA